MRIDFTERDLYNYKYIPLLHNTKRYNLLCGGAGSGKSVFVAQREIIKTFEAGTKLMVVRKVKDTHKDSTFAELCSIIDKWNLSEWFDITKSPLGITNKLSGSTVIFRGMDDPEKIKSVSNVNRIWIEEGTELTKEDFDQLDLRLRGLRNMQITVSFNPIDSEHWLNKDFWQHGPTEDVELTHSTFLDNRFVGSEYKSVLERLKQKNPAYYKIYALGEWGKMEGLVFEVQPEEIERVPDGAKLIVRGLDFGFTNDPTALSSVYEWNGGYILDEELYRTRMLNSDIIAHMKSIGVGQYERIIGDSAEPKSIEEIHRAGFNIHPAKKGPDSIVHGVNSMKSAKLYLTRRSVNAKKEFGSYVWEKDKNGTPLNKPVDFNNHFIDATRYAFSVLFDRVDFDITIG